MRHECFSRRELNSGRLARLVHLKMNRSRAHASLAVQASIVEVEESGRVIDPQRERAIGVRLRCLRSNQNMSSVFVGNDFKKSPGDDIPSNDILQKIDPMPAAR